MARLFIAFIVAVLLTVGMWLYAFAPVAEWEFNGSELNVPYPNNYFPHFTTTDKGRTWTRTHPKNNWAVPEYCAFENVNEPYSRIGGITRRVIPFKWLPPGIRRVLRGTGVCTFDMLNGDIFIALRAKIGEVEYSAMLIGYDAWAQPGSSRWRDSETGWNSWTLRPINGEPFIGDLASPYKPPGLLQLLIAALVPLPFLIHLIILSQVWQSVHPVDQRKLPRLAAFFMCLSTFTLFTPVAWQTKFSVSANISLLTILAFVFNSIIGAVAGYMLAANRQYSPRFCLRFAGISALLINIVPLGWVAGWWSWTLIIAALCAFMFYQSRVHKYLELRGGYKNTGWTIEAHLLRYCAVFPALFFMVGIPLQWIQFPLGEQISYGVFLFIFLAIFIQDIYLGLFDKLPKTAKKNAGEGMSDPQLQQWKDRQNNAWVYGQLAILSILWIVQIVAFSVEQVHLRPFI